MKKLLLCLAMTPMLSFAQYNVAYTVTILRLKANADDCDGGAPFCINAPQDPVFNIWTNDGGGNINTNCWTYDDDNAAAYGLWIDIQNLELANETGVNTSYINVEMSGHESDNIGSPSCSPDSGDDAVISQTLAQQFILSAIPENTPYITTVDIQSTYFAEIKIVWDDLTTGVIDLESDMAFRVSPNPSNGIFTVELSGNGFEAFDLKVIDISGREVYSDRVNGQSTNVELHEQPGVYFVEARVGNEIGRRKIIVK